MIKKTEIMSWNINPEDDRCPVADCDETFPIKSPSAYRDKIVHLLKHFHSTFPLPSKSRNRQRRIGGSWRCPLLDCEANLPAEMGGSISQHKIKHVMDNQKIFT